ncbi:unnamed protein product [Caenorhabditis auriculariae]|uniref:Uncharacterized protein n=1 Tax=Caenorhabditis auriculariae TaxID=2777116 RepID=A0A8S1GTD4_9PELO|nr:unnamed protein product [Caenorhabditis auriculariae]
MLPLRLWSRVSAFHSSLSRRVRLVQLWQTCLCSVTRGVHSEVGGVVATAPTPLAAFFSPANYALHTHSALFFPTIRSNLNQIMSTKKKNLIVKLLKFVGRGNQVQSSKTCLAQIYEERKKQRQRSSTSSHLSHIEPMPTIFEEDEYAACEVCV